MPQLKMSPTQYVSQIPYLIYNTHSQSSAGSLYKILEPDPAQMGIIGAGSIGGKAESIRQAINKSTKALNACAVAEDDGKMKNEHVESILQRAEDHLSLLLDAMKRISVVYYDRFCELGMGLPEIVKIALVWIQSSSKTWLSTLEQVNKCPDLVGRITSFRDQMLMAQVEALDVYKGIKG